MTPDAPGKIAVEEHILTPECERYLPDIGLSPEARRSIVERLMDVDGERLAEMDRNGIDMAILSLSSNGIQGEPDPRLAVRQASLANDAMAAIVARRPERYAGLAAVPLQDPAAAIAELDRAVADLKLSGVLTHGYTDASEPGQHGIYYDDERFWPFWERLEGLGVPLYLHPRNPMDAYKRIYQGRPELLGPAWAFAVETGTHALRLITSGLFDRFPGLQVILGHMGEFLPFALDRMEQRLSHIKGSPLRKPVTQYLRDNFYVTTSGNFHTPSLMGTIMELGSVDRILFAVDYPFEDSAEATAWFDAVPLPAGDREKIARTNAHRLFKL